MEIELLDYLDLQISLIEAELVKLETQLKCLKKYSEESRAFLKVRPFLKVETA